MAKNLLKYLAFLSVLLLMWLAGPLIAASPQTQSTDKISLRVLYVGLPDTERQRDFVTFLGQYFQEVKTANYNAFKEEQTRGFDVAIFDKDGIECESLNITVSSQYSLPTISLGVPGAFWAGKNKLKMDYLWNCLSDAAHAESFTHEIFNKPLKVNLQFELADIPPAYTKYQPGIPDKLMLGAKKDKMQVLFIQKSGKRVYGAVTKAISEEDAFDAEGLLYGYTDGKGYQASGLRRHGNFMQWGWACPPSQMTEAGRQIFINSVVYINKFKGQLPLTREQAMSRKSFLSNLKYFAGDPKYADVLVAGDGQVLKYFTGDPKNARRFFPADLIKKYESNLKELIQYYQDQAQLLYFANNLYYIDEQMKSLGFTSNSQLDNLPQLISLLDDKTKSAVAQELLVRYTGKIFTTAPDWQKWLELNKGNLVFLETAGYRFFVIPKPKTKS